MQFRCTKCSNIYYFASLKCSPPEHSSWDPSLNMVVPKRKRVNTIGIRYVTGSVMNHHYKKIFDGILGVHNSEIIAISERNNTHIIFKLSTSETYDRICANYTYECIDVDVGHSIVIDDISSYDTVVNVRLIPFEVSSGDMLQILGEYGTVKHRYYRSKYNNEYFQSKKTDRMCIIMSIEKPIPSTIFVVEADDYIYLTHPGQIPTCHTCGRMDHKVSACTDKVGKGTNVVSLDGDVDNEPIPGTPEAAIDEAETAIHNTEHQVATTGNTQPRNQADSNSTQIQNLTVESELLPQVKQTNSEIISATRENTSQIISTTCENTYEPESTAATHQDTHTGENHNQCTVSDSNLHTVVSAANTDITHLLVKTNQVSAISTPSLSIIIPEREYSPTLGLALGTHTEPHKGENQNSCSISAITNTNSENENNANNTINETEIKTFLCTKCGYTSTHKNEVEKHIQSHIGERNIKCQNCVLTFHTMSDYEDHTQAHKGKKQFRCTECDYKTNKCDLFINHLVHKVHMKKYVDSGITRESWSKVVKSTKKIKGKPIRKP